MGKLSSAALLAFAALLLFPLYWMAAGSLQTASGVLAMPPALLPRALTLENYRILFRMGSIARWTANTALVAGASTAGAVLTAAMAGYGFAMFRFRGREFLWWCFVAALAIPRLSLLIPEFVTLRKAGLGWGFPGVVVPLLAYPVGVLIFRGQVEALPASIADAARIDGAGEWALLTRIVGPLSAPALGTLAIFKGLEAMGDYLWQSLILSRRQEQTLVVGLLNAVQARGAGSEVGLNPLGLMLATGVVLAVPMVAVFVAFQRHFATGLLGGALRE